MYLSNGNIKLNKNVLVWNLPRLLTCPGAGVCREWCYEIKAERRYKNVVKARSSNLRHTYRQSFVTDMVTEMKRRKFKYVRVHASGDFYSQAYLHKWYDIARLLPDKKFYAYTKSLHLDLWAGKPDNFKIIQSYGGIYDSFIDKNKPYNRVIGEGEVIKDGEFLCSSDSKRDGTCGGSCTLCMEDPNLKTVSHRH